MLASPVSPLSALAPLRAARGEGVLTRESQLAPGVRLHCDPALDISGRFRSPAGRLLELEAEIEGRGHWVGLHVTLSAPDAGDDLWLKADWLTLTCRSAAPVPIMLRACLRSGPVPQESGETGSDTGENGFTDCFFDKHILAGPEPANHVDVLHVPTRRRLPGRAAWRELILFLPRENFRWHLHDLSLVIA